MMKRRSARCILIVDDRRCHRRAAVCAGDLFTCASHGLIAVAVMADRLCAASRRLLAFSEWESRSEGQRLLDKMRRRRAA